MKKYKRHNFFREFSKGENTNKKLRQLWKITNKFKMIFFPEIGFRKLTHLTKIARKRPHGKDTQLK
jgi:hypothetical protein